MNERDGGADRSQGSAAAADGSAAAGRTAGFAATLARALMEEAKGTQLVELTPARLVAYAAEALGGFADRRPGRVNLQVRPSSLMPGCSVVEMLNDDMPFLLDSGVMAMQARGIGIRLVLHPILAVRRDAAGRLLGLEGLARPDAQGVARESFISIHVDELGREQGQDLLRDLDAVFGKVRAAVVDWRPMLARLDTAIDDLARQGDGGLTEAVAFLRWLKNDNFTFLGMRELKLDGTTETGVLRADDGDGLGLLRDPAVEVLRRGTDLVATTPEVRRFLASPEPLIVAKSNVVSDVHRHVQMDYVGVKTFAADGRIAGELRIVGLFTSRAYLESPLRIPLLRAKVETVRRRMGFIEESHDGKALINVIETFPRDELYQIDAEMLAEWVDGILDLELRPRVRMFVRVDRFDRFVSVVAYLPRDRYSSTVRESIGNYLAEVYDGRIAAFYPTLTEASLVRVHFIVARFAGPTPVVAAEDLERSVGLIMQTWQDRLLAAVDASAGRGPAARAIAARYAGAFSAGYAETFGAPRALEDIARIERLSPERPIGIDFYREDGTAAGAIRAAIYRLGAPMPLSDRVPLLENLGLRVIDERSFKIAPRDGGEGSGAMAPAVTLHDMMLELPGDVTWGDGTHDKRLEECFLAVERGIADNDGYNRLVIASGLDWRQVALFRAYGAYMRQIGLPFGPRYLSDTLVRHGAITRALADLFETLFRPDREDTGEGAAAAAAKDIGAKLADFPSVDEERVLRHFLNLVQATKRTNFYRPADDGRLPETMAFKLASHEIDGAPQPRPFREIWVYSPSLEGVHLRFAPIARGGIRWSDRPLDFRTEVLGLCKAQQVKNAVIVPAGAKGGFVPKRLPRGGSRDEIQKEGIACYQLFVSTLLDLTDNLKDGRIVPPRDVRRRDGDDPYLVVAADKGTATFSDFANAIARAWDFWLGDAFASGGSQGYDHKHLGITARGAWECVKRHFREMDWDIQTRPFRCIGVGDMSGDVFGNGMLLSPVTRLVAAFDHRDIFIDPAPDPAVALAERRRLFDLPRSSWQDYDKSKLSKGGGVFSRSARSIPLSDEMRSLLATTAPTMSPNELIRALLSAEADLLYFGGIGTYVRASSETDDQVGDRANDAIRVTGAELRVKVIGEGANLGMTQRGRIEFASRGGRLNTDFIDNSAGVNTSDQEVNIKIALGPAVKAGRLAPEARKALLASLSDEVAAAVLRNNYLQSQALSLAQRRGVGDIGFQQRLIRQLEKIGLLDRGLEALPTDAEIGERRRSGTALTRPELAVLLSYSKIALQKDLLASSLPDETALAGRMLAYVPAAVRERFRDDVLAHPLRREIVATGLTNQVINRGGSTFVVRLVDETGRAVADIVKAFITVESVFGLREIWARIDGLDNKVPGAVQNELHALVQQLVLDRAAWFLRRDEAGESIEQTSARHAAAVATLRAAGLELLPAARRAAFEASRRALEEKGVPAGLAGEVAALAPLAEATDVAEIAARTGATAPVAAAAWLGIGDLLRFAELKARGEALAVSDPYDRLAINSALGTLASVQHALTRRALEAAALGPVSVEAWATAQGASLARARASLDEIAGGGELTVSRLSVAAGQMHDLVSI